MKQQTYTKKYNEKTKLYVVSCDGVFAGNARTLEEADEVIKDDVLEKLGEVRRDYPEYNVDFENILAYLYQNTSSGIMYYCRDGSPFVEANLLKMTTEEALALAHKFNKFDINDPKNSDRNVWKVGYIKK